MGHRSRRGQAAAVTDRRGAQLYPDVIGHHGGGRPSHLGWPRFLRLVQAAVRRSLRGQRQDRISIVFNRFTTKQHIFVRCPDDRLGISRDDG